MLALYLMNIPVKKQEKEKNLVYKGKRNQY